MKIPFRSLLVIVLILDCDVSSSQNDRTRTIGLILESTYNINPARTDSLMALLDKNDPALIFLKATNIRWTHFPVTHDSEDFNLMLMLLDSAGRTRMEESINGSHEVVYIRTVSTALSAMYKLESNKISISEARNAYDRIVEGMSIADDYPDFLLTSGIYNYLRDKFPERFYWAWLIDNLVGLLGFQKGDSKLGLNQLEDASYQTTYSQNEALLYLAHFYLRYENNPIKSRDYLKILCQRFPKNCFFKTMLNESRYWSGDIDQIDWNPTNCQVSTNNREFYEMITSLFRAVEQEFKYQDTEESLRYYQHTLDIGKEIENEESLVYQCIAYHGIIRLNDSLGKDSKKESKQLQKISPYESLKTVPHLESW